jgi:hypothetical protein
MRLALVLVLVGRVAEGATCNTCNTAKTLACPISLACSVPASMVNGCPAACATGPTVTTSSTVTSTTVPAASSGAWEIDPDGAARLGQWCRDLVSWRSQPTAAGEWGCGRNGDIYITRVACTTGSQRPPGMPYVLGTSAAGHGQSVEVALPAGATVYPGWAGWDNWGYIYTAANTCQSGAVAPTWCSAPGCTVVSGGCVLGAKAATPQQTTFGDGSCVWSQYATDIGMGGAEGPTARTEMGRHFPEGNSAFHFGDNEQPPGEWGRGDYGGPDEPHDTMGAWQDFSRSGGPGSDVRVGFTVVGGPTLGVATSPPPLVGTIAGTMPTTTWGCFTLVWENSLGGVTRVTPMRCAQATLGGLRVTMPARDGWQWPVPFPVGKTMARIYQALLPSAPCTPNTGQTTCTPALPRQLIQYEADYLYSAADAFDLTSSTQEEFESQPFVNSTGQMISPFQTYEATVGLGQFTVGSVTSVGGPGAANPDNGWYYAVYGSGCIISADGCRKCNRSRSTNITLTSLPTTWRTDRIPFGTGGVCFQRAQPKDVGTVFHSNGYTGGCTWRYQEPYTAGDGTTQMRDVLGLCMGELQWFGPQGVHDILRRCNANGCS